MNILLNDFGLKLRILDKINMNIEKTLESGDEINIEYLLAEKNKLITEIIDMDVILLRNIEKCNYLKAY